MTDDTNNQLDIEDAEIMAELEAEGRFEMRARREMDALEVAAEIAEARDGDDGAFTVEPAWDMALMEAEARYNREAREQAGDSALTD